MVAAQKRRAYGRKPIYLVDGLRTPLLKARSRRGPFAAADLAVAAGRSLLLRLGLPGSALDELILGCVAPAPDEANIARIVALRLGCGHQLPAYTVQRNCASGMQALDSAAKDIALGRADLVLAGGTETMSRAPVLWQPQLVDWLGSWSRAGSLPARLRLLAQLRPGWLRPDIGLLRALRDPVVGLDMGQTAEELATRFRITREEMDRYALRSHRRCVAAREAGFLDEIEPLVGPDGVVYDRDTGVRDRTSMAQLAQMKPVFDRPVGRVTAGNSSQITDGAAVVLLASAAAVKQYRLPVLAQIEDSQWAGVDPAQMGLGPVHACAPLLTRHRLSTRDIDCWEINEAFAAQVIACQRAAASDAYGREALGLPGALGEIPDDRLNVDGGAVACGHPVGVSGARIVLHLARVLRRTGGGRGLAAICIGGGQGGAMLLKGVAADE